MKREEKRKWICLTYAGVYPSTKEVRHTTGKSTTSKHKKPPDIGSISHTSCLQELRQNPEPESETQNGWWTDRCQRWNGMRNVPFLGDGLLRHSVEDHNSERASERRERRNYTTQKRAHVETHSAAAGGRLKICHHSRWAVYSFTAYKLTPHPRVKLTQVKYTLLLSGVTKQPELTFNCWLLFFVHSPFGVLGPLLGDSFFYFSFWELISGILSLSILCACYRWNLPHPPKEKEGTNNGPFFGKWKLRGSNQCWSVLYF